MSQNDVLASITEVLGMVASVDSSDVAPDKTFAELGLDSLATLEAIVAIEDRVGLLIPDDEWLRFKTVGDVVRYIEQTAATLPQ